MKRLRNDELSLKSGSASSVGHLDFQFPVILSSLSRQQVQQVLAKLASLSLANTPFPRIIITPIIIIIIIIFLYLFVRIEVKPQLLLPCNKGEKGLILILRALQNGAISTHNSHRLPLRFRSVFRTGGQFGRSTCKTYRHFYCFSCSISVGQTLHKKKTPQLFEGQQIGL